MSFKNSIKVGTGSVGTPIQYHGIVYGSILRLNVCKADERLEKLMVFSHGQPKGKNTVK